MSELITRLKSLLTDAAQARRSGRTAEAERLYREAAAEAKAKDDIAQAEALMGIAQTRRDEGDLTFASIHYAEAITILRGANAVPQLAFALRHAADVRSELREFAVSGAHIEEAIRLYRALVTEGEATPLDLANALRVSALNDEREAHASWREAWELYAQLSIPEAIVECNEHLECLKHHADISNSKQEPHV